MTKLFVAKVTKTFISQSTFRKMSILLQIAWVDVEKSTIQWTWEGAVGDHWDQVHDVFLIIQPNMSCLISQGCLDHVFEIAEQGVSDKGCHSDFQFRGCRDDSIGVFLSSKLSLQSKDHLSLFLTFPHFSSFSFSLSFSNVFTQQKRKKRKKKWKSKERKIREKGKGFERTWTDDWKKISKQKKKKDREMVIGVSLIVW